ncbi:ENO4 Enolase, partial [Nothocercus nigrocapillus]|nr:ENO4 Enolase [Nothocercus nigrocapillus]
MEAEVARRRRAREAAEYYCSQDVPRRLEEALNALFPLRPADLYGDLANCFSKFSKAPVICKLVGRKVLDGVGRPTLEVEIYCIIKNYEKRVCSTVISSDSQILENALSEATEADEKERNDSVNTAVEWVNESLNTLLRDLKPTEQCEVDKILGEYFTKKVEEEKEIQKEKEEEEEEDAPPPPSCVPPTTALSGGKKASALHLAGKMVSGAERTISPAEPMESVLRGSSAIGATSLAAAKAGATISHIPLYLYIALLKHDQDLPKELTVPLPMVSLLNCGKFSPGKLKLMKEIMLIPPVHLSLKESIERILDIQKEVVKLLEAAGKGPSPQLADKKKSGARGTGKKVLPSAIKRISHLGCLIMGFDNLEQPLLLMQAACSNIGLELGADMYLAINCAAHELIDYVSIFNPSSIRDSFLQDRQQWDKVCYALGSQCYLLAEDAATRISRLVTDRDMNLPKCSGAVLKYVNQTKVSDLLELTGLLHGQRHITILGSPDGESSDDSLVDLAVGLGAKFIKLGGLCRGERVTKYNRLLAIEEELAKNSTLR